MFVFHKAKRKIGATRVPSRTNAICWVINYALAIFLMKNRKYIKPWKTKETKLVCKRVETLKKRKRIKWNKDLYKTKRRPPFERIFIYIWNEYHQNRSLLCFITSFASALCGLLVFWYLRVFQTFTYILKFYCIYFIYEWKYVICVQAFFQT